MSKKLILGIILTILIIIIGLTFGITTIVKFCKLQIVISKIEENVIKENYYINIKTMHNGETTQTETFYREGLGKLVSGRGVYTWTNGKDAYIVDENQKKAQKLSFDENTQILITNAKLATLYPTASKNVFERFFMMGNMENKIKTVEDNGKKYIYIEINEDNYTKPYWLEKDRCNLVKAKLELSNGDVYDCEYEIKYYTTSLKDVELPDLSMYTVLEIEEVDEENLSEDIVIKEMLNENTIIN